MAIDLTWISYVALVVVVYYGFLFALSLLDDRRRQRSYGFKGTRPFFVLVIPAHNEELVIAQTLSSLGDLDYPDHLVVVMNDGSTDATSELARSFEGPTGHVEVVDRSATVAGQGKGAVLNHAFRRIVEMVERHDPRLGGRSTNDIVIGIVDADGQLERHTLSAVAELLAESRVGGVQTGVRIANAEDGLLARMQDIEFTGFSSFVQRARDRFSSVGLGGNGQFTRLSALRSLDAEPWTGCLTEDLDLGLSLVEHGWRIRFCSSASVAQQGLQRLRPLIRQRTRWIQGHYQCWRHIPSLLRARGQRFATRIDLCAYLLLVAFVMLVFVNVTAGVAEAAGWIDVENHFLSFLPDGAAKNVILELMAFGPILTFFTTYQRRAARPLAFWEVPAYGFAFAVYGYVWVAATMWAWLRIALRRGAWAKTQRVAARAAV